MLNSEDNWFTPENINEYQAGAVAVDESAVPTVVATGGDHPPLSSPGESPQNTREHEPQFHTQAPLVMDESQFRPKKDEGELANVVEEYEWDPTPQAQKSTPPSVPAGENPPAGPASETQYDWEESPLRAVQTKKMVLSSNLQLT